MPSEAGFLAVLVIDLHFPEAGSLKSKRKDLQSIRAGLQGRFGAAVAETDHHDLWQRATLSVALTSRTLPHLHEIVEHLERWLDARCPAGVRVERIFASADDLRDLMSTVQPEG